MGKTETVKEKIKPLLEVILNGIAEANDIDHFEIKIKNHCGDLHIENTSKAKVKAY